MCARPSGLHVQSLTEPTDRFRVTTTTDGAGAVISFTTNLPGNAARMDFKIRYCCQTSENGPTTIPTIRTTQITMKTTTIPTTTTVPLPMDNAQYENKPCPDDPSYTCSSQCGGTIIDSRHILTAAHCINTTNPATITITAGMHNKLISEQTRQVKQVERIFMHPEYNDVTIQNDIAIIRLSSPLQTNKNVQICCLPGSEPQPDSSVIISGWGSQHMGGSSYHQLKQASVKIVGSCRRFWRYRLNEGKQLCAGNSVTGFSTCKGDSGSALMHQSNGQWIVAGVTSFGSECNTQGDRVPNVFTRVSAYRSRIKSIIN